MSATPPPTPLREIVERWRSLGSPSQPGIEWPRERWATKLPGHNDVIDLLPDRLDRASVRAVAIKAATGPAEAVRAFVAVMVWGYGDVGYGPYRTNAALETPDAAVRLQQAAYALAEFGPRRAYRLLSRNEDCRLELLGPAFGTKYLYFCRPRIAGRTPLILDKLVAAWLERESDVRFRPTVWSETTYDRYLDLMHDWASTLECAPDEVEMCIFRSMATQSGGQWAAT